jgi:hypothetical protein
MLFNDPSGAPFVQEFLGRHKERVLLEDPADDNHRVRAHDVDDCVTTKLCEVVNANHRVLVTRPYVIHAGFEFYEIVYVRSIRRPVHLADDTAQAEIALRRSQLLEHVEHPVLIEPAIPKVCLGIGSHLELSGLLCGRWIDASQGQSLYMIAALTGIDEVNGLIAACEPVADERKQYAIRLFVAVEEGADMAILAKEGSSKPDRFSPLSHRVARSL